MPLIVAPFHHNHILLRWQSPGAWLQGPAEHFRVIGYDSRGQGMSTTGLTADPTFEDYRRDLEAVIEATGVERFALAAYGGFGHVILRYAVDHPDRVTALILICSCEDFAAWHRPGAFLDVAEENWDLYLELQVRKFPPDVQPLIIAWFKRMGSQADYVRLLRGFLNSPPITDLLPKVSMPTLLLHSLDQHWLPPAEGAKVAAKIPNARIIFTDGDIEPDFIQGVAAINSFLKGVLAPGLIGPQPKGAASEGRLSHRQVEVLSLISQGKTTREIAEALVLSERTVERHVNDLYSKIGARNRSEATAYALSRYGG
jgi:pimeloyl-ACP methyl ester carboxylesterase/DNA-binding CsgD family transcriptional regulator